MRHTAPSRMPQGSMRCNLPPPGFRTLSASHSNRAPESVAYVMAILFTIRPLVLLVAGLVQIFTFCTSRPDSCRGFALPRSCSLGCTHRLESAVQLPAQCSSGEWYECSVAADSLHFACKRHLQAGEAVPVPIMQQLLLVARQSLMLWPTAPLQGHQRDRDAT